MKDYRQLFGYAAILFGLGFLVRSFMPAYAITGPTVSLGSNPVENFYEMPNLSGGTSVDIFTNSSSQDFVLTTYMHGGQSSRCGLTLDGQNIFVHTTASYESIEGHGSKDLRLMIPAGSVLRMKNYNSAGTLNCPYYIEGHYIHTP